MRVMTLRQHRAAEIRYTLARLALALAATLLLIAPALAQAEDQPPELVKVTQSPMDFAATVDAFKQEATEAGWSVLNVNNMAGVLSARGYTLHPVQILDVCSGKYSAEILRHDEFRPISALMPCRVSIYQTSAGDVFITRMHIPAFLGMMPDGIVEVMEASSQEIEGIIARTVDR